MNYQPVKQLFLKSIAAAILSVCIVPAQAETPATHDDVMYAVGVLKGIYDGHTKEKAVGILQEAAEKDSMAYAMNVLGLLYAEGVGTEQDSKKAVYWLNRACEKGFREAYHNLGALYKLGKGGVKQDFAAAYSTFQKGADAGSDVCMYDAGFMRYKGLGCEQSYPEAMRLFEAGADRGNVYALYMLGLCYRNGYGTDMDEEKGMELLNRAATLGYSAAMEEAGRPRPENCLSDISAAGGTVSSQMPGIRADVNDTTLLKGLYSGYVVMYDWSGKFVIGEKPVVMSLGRKGNDVLGYLCLGSDSVPFKAELTTAGTLNFKKSYVQLHERYTLDGKVKYRLDHAALDIWSNRICGSLALYSLPQREPERPMYMELLRSDHENATGPDGHITVTPNPFESQFEVLIELPETATTTVRIFDKAGRPVWRQDLGTLAAGKHRIPIHPSLTTEGYHVLNITTGKLVLRTMIVKRGGGQ